MALTSELLPLPLALACPLGMLAMMAAPALARRVARRTERPDGARSTTMPLPSRVGTDERNTAHLATTRR
jgi:hypothetical protein